jgi:hypothetical protein
MFREVGWHGWQLPEGASHRTCRARFAGDTRHNRRPDVVGAEVITPRHRNIALLVAGCYFMEMLDGTNINVS